MHYEYRAFLVSVIRISVIVICFGFRASDFEFRYSDLKYLALAFRTKLKCVLPL